MIGLLETWACNSAYAPLSSNLVQRTGFVGVTPCGVAEVVSLVVEMRMLLAVLAAVPQHYHTESWGFLGAPKEAGQSCWEWRDLPLRQTVEEKEWFMDGGHDCSWFAAQLFPFLGAQMRESPSTMHLQSRFESRSIFFKWNLFVSSIFPKKTDRGLIS